MDNKKKIDALVQLLDDPDDLIFTHVKEQLIEIGIDSIPNLEKAWADENFGDIYQQRLESIIHDIQLNNVFKEIGNWILNPSNLLEGVLILNKYKYPNLKFEEVENKIAQLVADIHCKMSYELTPLEKIQVINSIVFDLYGFKGDKINYHNPENSYFNTVLNKKKGNPLMLSILYIEIASRIGLPIVGINLPNHFLVGFKDLDYSNEETVFNRDSHGILFYINPFSKGSILYHDEIDQFLKELKLKPHARYYTECTNIEIVKRILTNLIYSYSKEANKKVVEELKKINQLFNRL